MSKSNLYEAATLALLLNGTPIPGIADDAAASPLVNLFVSFHTADPTEAGDQTSNEIAYTGYERAPVVRSNASPAWTITGTNPTKANPLAVIGTGVMTGGVGGTITHFGIGALVAGAGELFYIGTVTPNIVVIADMNPQLGTGTEIDEE